MKNYTILPLLLCFFIFTGSLFAKSPDLLIIASAKVVHPLEELAVSCSGEGTMTVTDAKGNTYFSAKASPRLLFKAGGSAGKHTIALIDKKGKQLATATFTLEAPTQLNDGGKYTELFEMLKKGMMGNGRKGYGEIKWKGDSYKFFVPWDLDNSNVMNGIQYFSPYGSGLTDLLRETQREDGLIWSFVNSREEGFRYFETAYAPIHYYKKDQDAWFVRQPVDNHSDYCYVNMFYKHWKASGDNEWMKKTVASAAKALDYCYTDSDRWSKRFQLLKRPYCIDSWDFQVDDAYTPKAPVSPTMVIVPGKTKFGVFFGDNTGYYEACNQLSEMYDFMGEAAQADVYRKRGERIMKNLTALSWNGKFFTHFIDEDPTVKRDLGVDEKSQIAQGNMYSLNRGLPHEMNVAIIKTYLNLKENLPVGSPGEWYAIYPPFTKGFGNHQDRWQYMNGGIAGHAIGELARGAYENGYENYGSDILNRLLELGKKYNNKIYFSYTGSIPEAPAAPVFRTVDIASAANMDTWDKGGKNISNWMKTKEVGNDMRNLPVGMQTFKNITFNVIDPAKNNRRAVIAISTNDSLPTRAEVSIKDTATAVYLLHSISAVGASKIAGDVTFIYSDGTKATRYLFADKDVVGWWFPSLKEKTAGVAWVGPNTVSTEVGVCWAAIDNPNPKKRIEKLQFNAALDGGIYSVLAVTLADKPHYVKVAGESYGGPDNWAAANGMAALIEGLAGVKNNSLAYQSVTLSPRWTSAGVDSATVTANFPASNGYISYHYKNDTLNRVISLMVTGSGEQLKLHALLPQDVKAVESVLSGSESIPFAVSTVEQSNYVDFVLPLHQIQSVLIKY